MSSLSDKEDMTALNYVCKGDLCPLLRKKRLEINVFWKQKYKCFYLSFL